MYIPHSDDKHQMVRDSSKNALASADVIVTQLLCYHMPLLYFVCNHLMLIGFSGTAHFNFFSITIELAIDVYITVDSIMVRTEREL